MPSLLPRLWYPIFLSPMLGVVTPKMVAGVSEGGGLGGLPLGSLSREKAHQLITETKKLTNKIFAVNLFTNAEPDLDKNQEAIDKMRIFISEILVQKKWAGNLDFEYHFYSYPDLIDLIIEEGVQAVSFTFGMLNEASVRKLKAHNISLIGTATCAEEARLIESSGADMIVAQGIEAGGHRATFVDGELPQIKLIPLLNEITKTVKIPVVAAGGIYDESTMNAAFQAGAKGVQIGSYFIPAKESLASDTYRKILKGSTENSTTLTKSFSGRWARGIKNEFIKMTEGMDVPDYPIQNILTREMRNLAKSHNDYEYTSLWAGQNAGFAKTGTTSQIMDELIHIYKTIKH